MALPLIAITSNLVTSFTGFLNNYLNNVVGFSIVFAGSFATVFRVWDAFTAVGMGIIADKTNGEFGRFTPYMLIGDIGAAVVGRVMINLPPVLAEGSLRKGILSCCIFCM